MDKKVAVIGGGISGLVTAFKLKKAGVDVALFESGESVGGNIKTIKTGGYLYEKGPNSTLASFELLYLLDELGIRDQIAQPTAASNKRYIVKAGKLVALPGGLGGLLKGDVFSGKARLRLLKEPFVRSSSPEGESVAKFFERRLGKEIVDFAVDPFISGIYAGDPDKLSIRSAFPKLFEMERDHGSLFKAGLFGKRDKTKKVPKGTPRSITFEGGMETLSASLYDYLRESIQLNSKVKSIKKNSREKYEVATERNVNLYDAVVVSTTAHIAAGLLEGIDSQLAAVLSAIYYPPVCIVYTGFRQDQVEMDVAGFGFLVPGAEKRNVLGSLWTSSVFENRAPSGHHLFTTFVGGSRRSELCDTSDDELIRTALDELRSFLGTTGDPVFVATKRWKKAIPQYNVGYEKVPAAIAKFKKDNFGLYLCSNYYRGISVSDCVKNGGETAAEILNRFNSQHE